VLQIVPLLEVDHGRLTLANREAQAVLGAGLALEGLLLLLLLLALVQAHGLLCVLFSSGVLYSAKLLDAVVDPTKCNVRCSAQHELCWL